MIDIYPILHSCSIFDGIPEDKYINVLHCLQGKQKAFLKGQTITNIGEYSQMAGIILSGTVELAFFDELGNQINVNHIGVGEVFGSELACSNQVPSPMKLSAVTDCEILFLNFSVLLNTNAHICPNRARVTVNLLRDFARQTLFLNMKLCIMGQKRLRDKIKIYLQNQSISKDGEITIPFNRHEFADFLYVDRSALCRELSRMKSEGIISIKGRTITLLDKSFLNS